MKYKRKKQELPPFLTYSNAPKEAVGLEVSIKTTVDLQKEISNSDAIILRLRRLKLALGGKVPFHFHVERPAVYYII